MCVPWMRTWDQVAPVVDSHPPVSTGDWLQDPGDTKVQEHTSPLNKMAQHLQRTYAHPPVRFKSAG
jgi:hypothetical protein